MTLQPSKHFLPLIFPVLLGLALFADLGSALTLSADDSGSLLKYRYGIAVLQSNPLVAGERGGSDGHIGEGFTDFDHGYCLLSRSGTGNLGGECELPNSRDLGATYMVVKVQGWATCTGVVNRSSGYITLPGARSCNGSYSMESIPTPLHQLKGIGRGNMNTEGTTRATMNMEFRAKTGLVEYVGTANRAFIKFDLSRIRERFFSAQLNLFVAGAKTDFGSADGVIGVYAIDDFEALDEKDFDVQPLSEVTADFLGALGGEAGAVSTGYQSIDVTRAVFDALDAGKPSVSFLLKNSVEDFDGNSRFVLLGSHSSEYPPLLELKPNSSPVVQVSQPNGAEVLSDTTGQALLAFRFSDPDFNQRHTADVFLSEAPGQKGEPLVLGVSLDATHCMPEGPGPGGPRPAGPRPDGLGLLWHPQDREQEDEPEAEYQPRPWPRARIRRCRRPGDERQADPQQELELCICWPKPGPPPNLHQLDEGLHVAECDDRRPEQHDSQPHHHVDWEIAETDAATPGCARAKPSQQVSTSDEEVDDAECACGHKEVPPHCVAEHPCDERPESEFDCESCHCLFLVVAPAGAC